jgi:glyoxylase-like metal-dependent hydrolase (beta-lactamase superfamily II)
MRALGLHRDVIVFVSRVYQTTCTAVRAGEEGFLIDSPVYPDELEAVPGVLEQAGFPVSGLLVTHADWDHLLGRLVFPDAPLGCSETTAERLNRELGAAQRELRRFDEEHYVEDRRPLALAAVQHLPVPGKLELGGQERELELHPTGGHTADGMAIRIPWAAILIAGDYLSPVEIPMISEGGSRELYEQTLHRLKPLIEASDTVVPGHGAPQSREDALRIHQEDVDYLDALGREGEDAPLPKGRRTAAQRGIHARNARTS